MSRFSQIFKYLRYHIRSKRWDAFHSPYLFQLFNQACDESIHPAFFNKIEEKRSSFLKSPGVINRLDYGAGSQANTKHQTKQISNIARTSLSLPFQCRFMAKLAMQMDAKTILEFGTSLGISTAYLAAGVPNGKVISVEGDPSLCAISEQLFADLELKNIILFNQKFEDFIETQLSQLESIDLFFIDGNHRKESLLHYYQSARPYLHEHSIIIVDDIYWSTEMYTVWKALIAEPEITQSVECFHFGLLFFNHEFLNKENHLIHLPVKSLFR